MNTEQLEKSLVKVFAEPKIVGQKRHIVFWYDESGDFVDDIASLRLEWVKIFHLRNNYFAAKYLFEKEDISSDYLVYSDAPKPAFEDDWLLDILLYSKEFSADRSSVLMNELGITERSLKELVSHHIKFFTSKKRQDEFAKLHLEKNNAKSFELSLLATITNQKTLNFDDILKEVFIAGLDAENEHLEEFRKYGLEEVFWKYVTVYFAYVEEKDLKNLFVSLIVSNVRYSSDFKIPSHLNWFANCSNHANVFVNHFMNHKTDYPKYREYAREIEQELKLFQSGVDDLRDIQDLETVSDADKTILLSIAESLRTKKSDFERYVDIIHARQTKHWYDEFKDQYEALLNAIEIFAFKQKYEGGFVGHISAKDLFDVYSNEYYRMDGYYRKFNYHFDQAQRTLKNNYLSDLQKEIEGVYANWFLNDMTEKWVKFLKSEDMDRWFLPGVSKQTEFFEKEVQAAMWPQNDKRVFVIISDAFRYECAKDLEKLLEKERGVTTVSSMLGVIPSYTKLWMASLLPHGGEIRIDDAGKVFVGSIDSTSTEGRNKILNAKIPSIAIAWKNLSQYSQNDARELFKDVNLVYIYHNIIDSTGDDAKTEYQTFEACENAIVDLRDVVRRITGSWNGVNVLITADHGFIYKKEPLVESDKISLEKVGIVDNSRRFILTKDALEMEWTMKIPMDYIGNPWLFAVLPNGNSRFKIQGGGANFVHGSLSLQEITIPVVNFKYQKELKEDKANYKKEADIMLNNTNRIITTNMFTLLFHQVQPILGKLLEGTYRIGLWDGDTLISDEKTIIANKISDKIEDRIFRIHLTLKSWKYNKTKTYKLRIFRDGKIPTEQDGYDFRIDILIQNDFESIF